MFGFDWNLPLKSKIEELGSGVSVLTTLFEWFHSDVGGQTQFVLQLLARLCISSGVACGACDMAAVISGYSMSPHLYTHDTKTYRVFSPSDVETFEFIRLCPRCRLWHAVKLT